MKICSTYYQNDKSLNKNIENDTEWSSRLFKYHNNILFKMFICIACQQPADDQLYTEHGDEKYYYCHEHFCDETHLTVNKPKMIYISDLHLEFYKKLNHLLNYVKFDEWSNADILILAGDIMNIVSEDRSLKNRFTKLIKLFKQKYKFVMCVTGNHEYYGCKKANITINDADKLLKETCQSLGVIFLQKSKFVLQLPDRQINFFGCTLWTLMSEKTFTMMNDHKATDNKEIIKLHVDHEKWLRQELNKNKNDNVVITHHLPSHQLIHPKFLCSTINDGFCSNLDHMFNYKINFWIYGHSHESVRNKINNTYCANNPGGYPGEDKITDFFVEVLEI